MENSSSSEQRNESPTKASHRFIDKWGTTLDASTIAGVFIGGGVLINSTDGDVWKLAIGALVIAHTAIRAIVVTERTFRLREQGKQ